jgi:hypothetical protein
MRISLYTSNDHFEWNEFISKAKNSHFMFYREYMDYHSDRFTDFSIMVRSDMQELLAVLPANINNRTLYSHQGLTFGGLCIKKDATTNLVLEIFSSLINFLVKSQDIDKFVYKRLPDFYTSYPSQEDLYALFIHNSTLFRRDITVAIELKEPLTINSIRSKQIKKANKSNVFVSETNHLADFWNLLTQVLQSQHSVTPVHSLSEIELLRQQFPENIKCFVAKKDNEVIAGALIFENGDVVHTKYLANGALGRKLGGLDLVISKLIKKYSKTKRYFDFGISTENSGRSLNTGLISQKEGFGARAFVHDFFSLNVE